jgi:hypothetical protein
MSIERKKIPAHLADGAMVQIEECTDRIRMRSINNGTTTSVDVYYIYNNIRLRKDRESYLKFYTMEGIIITRCVGDSCEFCRKK